MRKFTILIMLLALVIGLAGCSAGTDSSDGGSKASEGGSSAQTPVGNTGQADYSYAAFPPETPAETDALAIAASDEGRKWASGDVQNGTPVQGDAFLAGYTFRIHDGITQYQVRVMNGKLYGYVGGNTDRALASPYEAGWFNDPEPETDRQREAWDLALAEVAKLNPDATQGGLESFVVLFQPADDGSWPEVLVYADRQYSNFAMGGPWYK